LLIQNALRWSCSEKRLPVIAGIGRQLKLEGGAFTMAVGAGATAIILKVGVVEGVTASVKVHAMRAREKFLR